MWSQKQEIVSLKKEVEIRSESDKSKVGSYTSIEWDEKSENWKWEVGSGTLNMEGKSY